MENRHQVQIQILDVKRVLYLANIAGEEDSHELIFPLQVTGHQGEGRCCLRTIPLLSINTHSIEQWKQNSYDIQCKCCSLLLNFFISLTLTM